MKTNFFPSLFFYFLKNCLLFTSVLSYIRSKKNAKRKGDFYYGFNFGNNHACLLRAVMAA